MDWLFRPIGRFLEWALGAVTAMNWYFDLAVCFILLGLTLYWFAQIWKHRHNDKGLFKK